MQWPNLNSQRPIQIRSGMSLKSRKDAAGFSSWHINMIRVFINLRNIKMTLIERIRSLGLYPYALHLTSISNLEGIVRDGGIYSRSKMKNRSFIDISDPNVQDTRAHKTTPQTNLNLHNYVPFFLSFKAPMVALRQDHNEDLVYIQVSIDIFTRITGCFLTDGNATNSNTKFEPLVSTEAFKILDLSVLYKVAYAGDKEKSRKKAAELLVPDFVPQNEVITLIFYSASGRDKGLEIVADSGINAAIKVWPRYFFEPKPIGQS